MAAGKLELLLEQYARQTPQRISISELIRTAQRKDPQVLIESAQLLQRELPIRMALRVKDMQKLPFIVGCNPYVKRVYELYADSFKKLLAIEPVKTLEDEAKYTNTLKRLVEDHADVIPKLSRGILECSKYITVEQSRSFLDRKIQARIGIRVLAEQHLALHAEDRVNSEYFGVIDPHLKPTQVIKQTGENAQNLCEVNYAIRPDLIINGNLDATIAYIPVHLEYIMFELLKNAFRASVESAIKQNRAVPAVEVTISKGQKDLSVRVRDRGGGVPYDHVNQIWNYSYTTVNEKDDEGVFAAQARRDMESGVGGPMAGLGYGLPMSKVYAEYFGGSLDLVSLHGFGCDVFLRLKHLQDQSVESV